MWLSEGTTHPPIGARGGEDGARARQYVRDINGDLSGPLGTYEQVTLEPGARVVSICSGGAGYGSPRTREPGLVARDVERGWVSAQRAREKYQVAVDEHGVLDATQTAILRNAGATPPSQ